MERVKTGIVILHYLDMEETAACIESVMQCLAKDMPEIVVVDNGSGNGTGELLQERYRNRPRVSVLFSPENLGYAKGNNIGFQYAKNELQCDYIVLLNNDTRMVQGDFIDRIVQEYEAHGSAVIGPAILKDGKRTLDNPGRNVPFGKYKLQIFILYYQVMYALSLVRLDGLLLYVFEQYVRAKKKRESKRATGPTSMAGVERVEDVALHGCCLVFTPEYVKSEEGLDPRTFMYMEEDILYEKMHAGKKCMVYLPDLLIEHKEAGATDLLFGKNIQKRRFRYRNTIISAKVLAECIRENEISHGE